MTTTTVDIVLIRDGDNLILQSNNSDVQVRLAFLDFVEGEERPIAALIQGQADPSEVDGFLDAAKARIENFVSMGGIDRERENLRLRSLLAEAASQKAA